jgi:hypothetical protein
LTTPISTFSKKAFDNSHGSHVIDEDLGVPVFSRYDDAESDNKTILVPCFHPSYLYYMPMNILRNMVLEGSQ